MGVSKVIIIDPNTENPEVLMDVTGDDTSAGVLLAGNVGTRNDGEKVTGNIPAKTSSDLTVSGATVTAPAGHYASSASATIASGTAGTPTATKGSVSNHSVNVTPSVTNTTGYISGGTQTGTPVSVSASELVSGTKSIAANGTGIDVTNYAAVDVDVTTGVPGLENSLCFSSPSSFTLAIDESAAGWDGTIEWTDGSQPWATWDGTSTLSASTGVLYLRGTGNEYITGSEGGSFVLTGTNISCVGNIETLLDYATVALGSHPTMGASCFLKLFFNCTGLTSAPALPATTLANYCYQSIFSGCTNLISAPALPATTLASHCYETMFYGCTSLTSAPALPATTLASYCYSNMFCNCTSLISAPELPATTLKSECYGSMFSGCTNLISAPALPAMTLSSNCYKSMFRGCTSLVSPPALPATTLATQCYYQMFYGCTSITSIPVLPATTLSNYCYYYMFSGCTSIKVSTTYNSANYPYAFRIPESGTGTTASMSYALTFMFGTTGGSFIGTPTINTVYYLSKPLPVDFTVDGDATASDVLSGKTAYANGSRVVGNIASKSSSDLTISGQTVTAPAGYYPSAASASVPATPLQTKSVTPTESAQTVTPDSGYALSQVNVGAIDSDYVGSAIDRRDSTDLSLTLDVSGVTVAAPAGYYDETASKSIPEGSVGRPDITVASDGVITVTQTCSAGYIRGSSATYREWLSTQSGKTVSPTESEQTAVAAGKYTTGEVKVGAIPSDYVGSAIDQRDSSDLTASGATVTAPAGYYEEAASKTVASGSATAPASISGTSATVSAGTNTLTLSKTVSVTPSVTAGYISSGTAGNSSVSLTADVTTKSAATITPTTSDQTIAAGTYLTGAQTIEGDSNLTASNIKKGVPIFGITGEYEMGSNRNLLDNWYFVGGGSQQGGYQLPINQRGQTSYAWNGMQYSIDRWKFDTLAAAPLEVQSDGVNLNASALTYGSPYMRQIIDNVEFFRGKQLTFSALVTAVSGSDSKGYLRVYDGTNSAWGVYIATDAGLWSTTFTVPSNASDFVCDIGVYDGRTVKVAAAKLELGEVSTLANDAPPDYGEELSRCIYSTVDWVDTYSSTGFARSNRNLLDNGWFTVNQRGVADGTTVTGNGYFADRWQAVGSGVQRVAGGGITVLGTAYHQLGDLGIAGKTVTLSILYSTGEVSSNTFAWTGTQFSKTFAYGTVNIYPSANQINIAAQSVNVTAAKLEIGDVSTLANDVPPNYGEELSRCLNSTANASDPYANAGFGFGITNPNLLDNAYFVNPVNQRGQTAYTGGYSIDRWKLLNNSGTLNVVSGGIQFTNTTSGYGYCTQRTENVNYNTTPCTFSLLTSTGDLYTRRVSGQMFSLPSGLYFYQGASNELAIRIPANLTAENSEIIVAMKIEIGTIQTLAHKENGVWVLNEIPHFEEELAKCQRYYWNSGFSSDHIGLFCGITNANGNGFSILVPTPVTMRAATPTVNASVGWVRGNGSQVTGYALGTSATEVLNGFVYGISIDKTSGFSPIETYWVALTRLTVSCDL